MKLLTLTIAGVVVFACVAVWARSRRASAVSDRWLTELTRRESVVGVDLPRWRTPAELKERARQERLQHAAAVRARMFLGKRA